MTSRATSERTVLGRYVLGPTIGRGATAVVRRARDRVTGDDVAVKSVPADLDLAPRVKAEVRAAQRLDHPGVVALLDWGEDDESLHLVWELVDGPSLLEVLRAPRGLDATEVVRIGAEVLSALGHAHRAGVVHRDVKPANILIGSRGRAKLSDFGVARLSGEAGLTLTGSVVGTVAYMAPEQARGEPAGPASDVYSACLVVYEGLTGSNPVSAPSPRSPRGGRPRARCRPSPAPGPTFPPACAARSTPACATMPRPGRTPSGSPTSSRGSSPGPSRPGPARAGCCPPWRAPSGPRGPWPRSASQRLRRPRGTGAAAGPGRQAGERRHRSRGRPARGDRRRGRRRGSTRSGPRWQTTRQAECDDPDARPGPTLAGRPAPGPRQC